MIKIYIDLEKCASLEWMDIDEDYCGMSFHLLPMWLRISHSHATNISGQSINVIRTIYDKDYKIVEAYLGIIADDKSYYDMFKIKLDNTNHIPVHSGILISDETITECYNKFCEIKTIYKEKNNGSTSD